jgi:prevent-host-death family protein
LRLHMVTRQGGSKTDEVGVRELKAKLSEHLSRVKAGATVVVTEHGKPVARLVPIELIEPPVHLRALIESGAVRWSGLPMLPHRPRPLIGSGKTPSQMISEDREDRF